MTLPKKCFTGVRPSNFNFLNCGDRKASNFLTSGDLQALDF